MLSVTHDTSTSLSKGIKQLNKEPIIKTLIHTITSDTDETDIKPTAAITMAIFPFENLTEGDSLALFCKSFSIDLITELSKFSQFQIIAYQSVQGIEPVMDSNSNALTQLNTDYFIRGSFRKDKGLIKINAQLFDSATQRLVWADKFEGKSKDLLNIQDDLLFGLVCSFQQSLNYDLLSQMRRKPHVKIKAYEYWLYGSEEVKKGSLESDLKARDYFQKAIDLEPEYSLAYSGMSLTYFNEWSCQLWDRWEVSQTGAFEWAKKAMELDDQNYIAALVLGRIYLYQGLYESAEYYLRKSLRLNANDPDSLIQIATCLAYLGDAEEANQLYEKTVSLNPAHVEDYYPLVAFILFELGHYAKAIALTQKCHNLPWVHIPAIFAATYFHFGDYDKMILYWEKYLQAYQKSIRYGDDFTLDEAVGWVTKVSPYKVENRMSDFLQYISKGTFNDNKQKTKDKPIVVKPSASINRFIKETDIWELSYDGQSIQLAEVKGFLDIQKLLANPMQSFHCAELMGSVLTATGEALLDEKAKKAYQKKILDLRQDIETAENHNDFDRLSALEEEYEKMIHHLSESLGLKGKVRQAGNPVEKARSAVTWRIRNAIAKIEIVLPLLGKHLSNSIKTGTICSYTPEQELTWSTN